MAGEQAGIEKTHSVMGRILKNVTTLEMIRIQQLLIKRYLIKLKKLEINVQRI